MGEALFELEQILRSKQKMTPQESDILMTCKSKALRDFTIGASAAFAAAWTATQRMNYLFRINLSGGVAALTGLWRFGVSLDSGIDNILGLKGSMIQRELANLIVRKYQNDPWSMRLMSKHFYSEKVFDDTTSDQPKLRWRHRNFFIDEDTHSSMTHESDSHDIPHNKETDLETKQVPMKPSIDMMSDPLDCVFGYSGTYEEIHHIDTPNTSPRIVSRAHKRSHRRRRLRHKEVSSDTQHA